MRYCFPWGGVLFPFGLYLRTKQTHSLAVSPLLRGHGSLGHDPECQKLRGEALPAELSTLQPTRNCWALKGFQEKVPRKTLEAAGIIRHPFWAQEEHIGHPQGSLSNRKQWSQGLTTKQKQRTTNNNEYSPAQLPLFPTPPGMISTP